MAETSEDVRLDGQQLAGALWEFWWMHGHLSEGRRWLDAALSLESQDTDPHRRARARALVGAALLASSQADHERADLFNAEALVLVRPTDEPLVATMATSVLGFSAEARGETGLAERLYEQAIELMQAYPRAWETGWQLANLGRLAVARGDLKRAITLLEKSLKILDEAGDRHGVTWPLQQLGRIAERQGDHDRSVRCFEQALASARDVGDKRGVAWSLGNLGRQARIQGDFAQAIEWLEASLRLSRDIGDRWGAALALGNLGRVALDRREHQRAAALFEESLVLSQSLAGRGRRVAYALHYLGVVAQELGQPERAGRLLGAAAALQEAGGRNLSPPDRAERERQVAGVRRALGDAGFAEAWEAGRALSLEQAVEYALAAPPASRAPAADPAGSAAEQAASPLSARELEVALLIARGMTNRQVAEALVISERTASTHVTHILNKLDFSTRAQVAAWAVERGLASNGRT